MDGKNFIDKVSFEFSSLDKLKIHEIKKCCEENSLAVIKNFISTEELELSKKKIRLLFSTKSDKIRQDDEYYKVTENYQRLCVGYGRSPGTGEMSNSRLMRVIYNPVFREDIFNLHDVYRKMIIFRNKLYDVKDTFCLNEPEGGVFSCSRIHQFPRGGGFLALHKDKVGIRTSNNANLKTFMHPLLIVDQKGEDFKTGGGIIRHNNKIIFYEDHLKPGDIAIYNGKSEHGVYNVDQEEKLDLDTFNGRSSILVSLFKSP